MGIDVDGFECTNNRARVYVQIRKHSFCANANMTGPSFQSTLVLNQQSLIPIYRTIFYLDCFPNEERSMDYAHYVEHHAIVKEGKNFYKRFFFFSKLGPVCTVHTVGRNSL